METSHRILAALIVVLLGAGIGAAFVKDADEGPLTIGPTPEPSTPTPSETFTFPGPLPTETQMFPTETGTAAGPEVSPGEELPRTGHGSVVWPAVLSLGLGAAGGLIVRRTARRIEL